MKYQYYFCKQYKAQLERYLQTKGIKYEIHEGEGITVDLISFSLWSNNKDIDIILDELKSLKVDKPLVFVKYSASEINNAKMLVMSPKKQVINIINREEAYQYSCKWISSVGVEKVNHREQVGILHIEKEPSIKTATAFWAEDVGVGDLFTDRRVRNLVQEYSLEGIKFENVKNKKGFYSENIFQVITPNIIENESIGFGYGERKEVCHVCGKEQFVINNIYQLHLDVTKIKMQSDLYMTKPIWGKGIPYPLYIISQRFYQALKKNKLVGGITVSPVQEL